MPGDGAEPAHERRRPAAAAGAVAVGPSVVIGRDCTRKTRPSAIGPLDVLRRAVVLLDPRAEPRELEDLVVGQHPAVAVLGGVSSTRSSPPSAPRTISKRLVPDADVEQPRAVLGDDVGVGLDLAADHHLAEAERGLDHDARSRRRSTGRR